MEGTGMRGKSMYGHKTIVKLVLLASAFATVSGCHQEDPLAKAALASLQKLQSKTEVGVSYEDYTSALGDANYAVRQYVDRNGVESDPKLEPHIQFVAAILGALKWYRAAGEVWSTKGDNPGVTWLSCVGDPSLGGGNNRLALCDKYPELVSTLHLPSRDVTEVSFSFGIKYSWTLADDEMKKAVAAEPK
jgi:hypothetical protein